jgi:diguanylate cyclase (GGDEF)-like protein
MDGSRPQEGPSIGLPALAMLMPMAVWVGPDGRIAATGPTIAKVCGRDLAGLAFAAVFVTDHPDGAGGNVLSPGLQGRRLNLRLRDAPALSFRGIAAPAGPGQGAIVNLSFGIRASDAVCRNALTGADFAPTDLTVELLYLTEVKAAVMEELAALNRRLRAARDSAEHKAMTDGLTGLANRRGFEAALARAASAARRGRPFALMLLDLDRFKAVNDTHGHAAGDAVLAAVAQALRQETRGEDLAARLGGDEFALILPGQAGEERLLRLAGRMIAAIERPVAFEGLSLSVGASIGIALSDLGAEPDRLLAAADEALYAAKRAGRGRAELARAG